MFDDDIELEDEIVIVEATCRNCGNAFLYEMPEFGAKESPFILMTTSDDGHYNEYFDNESLCDDCMEKELNTEDNEEGTCSCPNCSCGLPTPYGEICDNCRVGAHQG